MGVRFLVEAEDSGGSVTVFECDVPADARMPAPAQPRRLRGDGLRPERPHDLHRRRRDHRGRSGRQHLHPARRRARVREPRERARRGSSRSSARASSAPATSRDRRGPGRRPRAGLPTSPRWARSCAGTASRRRDLNRRTTSRRPAAKRSSASASCGQRLGGPCRQRAEWRHHQRHGCARDRCTSHVPATMPSHRKVARTRRFFVTSAPRCSSASRRRAVGVREHEVVELGQEARGRRDVLAGTRGARQVEELAPPALALEHEQLRPKRFEHGGEPLQARPGLRVRRARRAERGEVAQDELLGRAVLGTGGLRATSSASVKSATDGKPQRASVGTMTSGRCVRTR